MLQGLCPRSKQRNLGYVRIRFGRAERKRERERKKGRKKERKIFLKKERKRERKKYWKIVLLRDLKRSERGKGRIKHTQYSLPFLSPVTDLATTQRTFEKPRERD